MLKHFPLIFQKLMGGPTTFWKYFSCVGRLVWVSKKLIYFQRWSSDSYNQMSKSKCWRKKITKNRYFQDFWTPIFLQNFVITHTSGCHIWPQKLQMSPKMLPEGSWVDKLSLDIKIIALKFTRKKRRFFFQKPPPRVQGLK